MIDHNYNDAHIVFPGTLLFWITILNFLTSAYRLICAACLIYLLGPVALVAVLIGSLALAIARPVESEVARDRLDASAAGNMNSIRTAILLSTFSERPAGA